jgi:hypothetical protein
MSASDADYSEARTVADLDRRPEQGDNLTRFAEGIMNRSQRPRAVPELSHALNHKLTLYALAAGAAGVGVLTLAQPAESKVVYTKTHHVIGLNHAYNLDLTHDGTVDFLIQETQTGSVGFLVNRLGAKERPGNAVEGYAHSDLRYASALMRGAHIGSRRRFVSGGRFGPEMAEVQQSDTVFYKYYGPWTKLSNRYLGLKFKIHGKTHYGWARLSVADQGFTLTATLTGYAYETTANKSIVAGNTKGKAEVQPASLGNLARGASRLNQAARGIAPGYRASSVWPTQGQ